MQPRLDYYNTAPDLLKAMLNLEHTASGSGLEKSLIHLVKLRASQINGCAYCIHMHTTDARKHGETEMRLYMLNAWRESPLYTTRERAALEWTESLTLLSQTGAPDASYEILKGEFDDHEQVKLSLLIATINAWNRLCVGFRTVHPTEPRHANE